MHSPQVLSRTQELPNPSLDLRLSHSLTKSLQLQQLLVVTIDLGKSINIAFF